MALGHECWDEDERQHPKLIQGQSPWISVWPHPANWLCQLAKHKAEGLVLVSCYSYSMPKALAFGMYVPWNEQSLQIKNTSPKGWYFIPFVWIVTIQPTNPRAKPLDNATTQGRRPWVYGLERPSQRPKAFGTNRSYSHSLYYYVSSSTGTRPQIPARRAGIFMDRPNTRPKALCYSPKGCTTTPT